MARTHEVLLALKWVGQKLAAHRPLMQKVGPNGIQMGRVIPGSRLPVIVYQVQAPGLDTIVIGPTRIMSDPDILVKAITSEENLDLANEVASEIDAALHGTMGVLAGPIKGDIVSCIRVQPFFMMEDSDPTKVLVHTGGIYRIIAQGA